MLVALALWLGLPAVSNCHARPPAHKGVIVAQGASTINGSVTVTDESGLRVMRFSPGGSRQTAIIRGRPNHLELEYSRAVIAALGIVAEPRSALIVGLGGGAIPAFLRHHYPKMRIDCVDIDPVVVRFAKLHFDFKEDARMKAHVADGRKFIEDAAGRWDLIVLDAFSSSEIPRHLATKEFLQAVSAKLAVGGVAVANVWQPRYNRHYYSMRKTYRAVFKELHFVQVPRGSDIFLALNTTPRLDLAKLTARAGTVAKAKKFSFDLLRYIRRGYFADGGVLRGEVLVDAQR